MAVYGIEAVWVLGPLIWQILRVDRGRSVRCRPGSGLINPFVLAWAPYCCGRKTVSPWQLAAVLGGALALSAGLAAYAVLRLRAEVTNRSGSRTTWLSAWLGRAHARLSAWRPGPSLDDDPVLWREWRRGRPSRLARVVWGLFIAASLAGTGWGLCTLSQSYPAGPEFLVFVGGLQATFGLLLVSLSAPTVLAEERVRGSLDVLMTTPLVDRPDRPGQVVGRFSGRARAGPAARDRGHVHRRRDEPDAGPRRGTIRAVAPAA